ncbi:hypothetical protein M427DRAFT_73136 [Gonapodya prolifera JEL478]|uniref:F-box domain-containing protein n=1 Tax=Gonapodya prolifera (strain JEL478) TaxID=1344416 RepID=A0A139A301_GONPJ|nr:hypothetical protein M427DRAFT_73136 [Gonapodya prolifera JEL478]|eukprot:KXS11162.1 hypothetical protein M427DRAFT_73136 [Gonapodya prolifera JEL478]
MATSTLVLLRKLYAAITASSIPQAVPEELADTIQSCKERLNALERSKAGNAPAEVLDAIAVYLERKDLIAVTRVCLSWSNSARRKVWATLNLDRIPLRHRQMLNGISDETCTVSTRLVPLSAFAITTILCERSRDGWKYDTSNELGLPTTVRNVVFSKATDFNQASYVDDAYFRILGSFSGLTELEMFWPRSDTSLAPRSGAYPDPLSAMADMQHLKRLTIIMHRGLSEAESWDDNGNPVDRVGFKDIRNSPLCRGVAHLTIKENEIDYDVLGPRSEMRIWTEYDREILFRGLLSQFENLRSLRCGDVRSSSQNMCTRWTSDTRAFIREFLERMNWRHLQNLSFSVDFASVVRDLARDLYTQIASQCNSLRSLSLYTYNYDSAYVDKFSDPSLVTLLIALPALEELHLRPTVSRWQTEREFPGGQIDLEHIFTRHHTLRVFSFGISSLFNGTSLATLARLCSNLASLELSFVGPLTAIDVTNAVSLLPHLKELNLAQVGSSWRPVEMAHVKLLAAHPRLRTFAYSPYDLAGQDVEEVLFRRFGLK